MNQPISRKQHGFTDYNYIPLALPKLAEFKDEKTAVTLTRVLAGSSTRAEWDAFKKLPATLFCYSVRSVWHSVAPRGNAG